MSFLLWLIPSVVAAKYLVPQHKLGGIQRQSKVIPEAIQYSDPYNPSLDGTGQIPPELLPETYRGRIVYARPVQHQGQRDYAAQFHDVPYTSPSREVGKMIHNKIAFDTSAYSMVLPWDLPARRFTKTPIFYDNVYNEPEQLLKSLVKGGAPANIISPISPIKLIRKRSS